MGMIVLEDAFTDIALIVMDSELSLNEFDIENWAPLDACKE